MIAGFQMRTGDLMLRASNSVEICASEEIFQGFLQFECQKTSHIPNKCTDIIL